MEQKILDALKGLDVENDENWTGDGAVRVDVVSGIVGEEVTRAAITKVAPAFNRKNPSVVIEDLTNGEGGDTEKKTVTEVSAPTETFSNPWAQTAQQAKKQVEAIEETNKSVQEQLDELGSKRVEVAAIAHKANADLRELDAQMEKLSAKLVIPQLSIKQQLALVHAADAAMQEQANSKQAQALKLLGEHNLL